MSQSSGDSGTAQTPLPGKTILVLLAAITAVFWAEFCWVRPTNFSGWDEWLLIDLSSRHVVGVPYANRPLVLLWTLPAQILFPHTLTGFFVVYTTCLTLTGWFLFLLTRRLLPDRPDVGFLAGAVAVTWAPLDYMRLDVVLLTGYAGFTLGAVLAATIFVESFARARLALLAMGLLVAFITVRGFEGTFPLIAGIPLLGLLLPSRRPGTLLLWIMSWEAVASLGVLTALAPAMLYGAPTYQTSALGLDVTFTGVGGRLLRQYAFHLLPLATPRVEELVAWPTAVALVVFLTVCIMVFALLGGRIRESGRLARYLLVAAVGLIAAGFGWSALVLSPHLDTPARMQFLSGPGIALFLASCLAAGAALAPARVRPLLLAAGGAWIVSVGTARTVSMQRDWESTSYWPAQNRSLVALTRQAPDLLPNTLVLLVDEAGAWPATFTFRHAVEYLYARRGTGYVWKASDFLYPIRLGREGIRYDPWPVIRSAWDSRPSFHGYGEIVVVRLPRDGDLQILDAWPDGVLPPLPPGARYAPRERIVRGSSLPPSRRILVMTD